MILFLFYTEALFTQDSTLINLPLMTWYQIPNSKLESVKPNPLPAGYFSAIIDAWSGGAFDSKRNRLIVWGGGHSDYAGNEVYVFDLNNLKWTRLTDPSRDVGGNESSGEYPDGNPRSRHTYNYIQYVPTIDKFFTFGGHGLYPSGQIGTNKTHSFNFETNLWTRESETPCYGIGAISAIDMYTGNAWVHGTGGSSTGRLARYDPYADSWTVHSDYDATIAWNYYLTADIDPKRKKLVAIGRGDIYSWDISDLSNVIKTNLHTTGDTDIIDAASPGFQYDPVGDCFVAWKGGLTLYSLNIESAVWTKLTLQGSNPGAAAEYGTFGRFRYVPSINGFVLVNSVNDDVFFVKISHSFEKPQTPQNLRILK